MQPHHIYSLKHNIFMKLIERIVCETKRISKYETEIKLNSIIIRQFLWTIV